LLCRISNLIIFKYLEPVNYTNGTPGGFVASGSSLVLPRATADTRGQCSTLHYTGVSVVRCAIMCKSSRGGRRRGGEKEGRGNGGRGEGSRSDCWWQGSRSLGDRRMRWKEACYGGAGVMERSCAVARGKDINTHQQPQTRGAKHA
jgi:hypothetical protein